MIQISIYLSIYLLTGYGDNNGDNYGDTYGDTTKDTYGDTPMKLPSRKELCKMFKRADADKNHKLSMEELYMSDDISDLTKDSDYDAYEEEFKRHDRNKDDMLSFREFRRFAKDFYESQKTRM